MTASDEPPVPDLALVGPTAIGKTEAAVELARRLGAEIVSCDSTTVYRGMDIATAKPSPKHRAAVPHHLLDVAEPTETFSVALFQSLARAALEDIAARGRRSLLVGGSGLYYRAVADDLEFPGTDPGLRALLEAEGAALGPEPLHRRLAAFDPDAAAKIEPANARRSVRALEVAALTGRPFSSFAASWERFPDRGTRAAGVTMPSALLYPRIAARTRTQFEGGLLDEVRGLLERGAGPFLTSSQAIGYLEAMRHLDGDLTLDEAVERAVRRTKALSRRQMAWFRRDPRIRWFEADARGAAALIDDLEGFFL